MSELVETPVASDGPVLPVLTDATINDEAGYWTTMGNLLDAARKAIAAQTRADNATAKLAECRAMIRSFFILKDGIPDWAADSDAYSVAVQNAENALYVNMAASAKSRLGAAVRQQVRRKYLLPTIVGYVLTHTPNMVADEVDAWFGSRDDEGNFVDRSDKDATDARNNVLANPSDKLKNEVRKHYRARDISIPDGPFNDVVTVPNDTKDPVNPATALTEAVAKSVQLIPLLGTLETLHLLSLVSARLIETRMTEVEGRTDIIAVMERITLIADTTGRALDPAGNVTDDDLGALTALYFDSAKDAATVK